MMAAFEDWPVFRNAHGVAPGRLTHHDLMRVPASVPVTSRSFSRILTIAYYTLSDECLSTHYGFIDFPQ